MKKRTKATLRIVGLLSLTLLIAACSDFSNPVASANTDEDKAAFSFDYQPVFGELYPPITEQMLAEGPAPGYRYVMPRNSALDTDSLMKSERCRRNNHKDVKINHLVKIRVDQERVPQDTTVTIVAPLGYAMVADFYPHPLQFTGSVVITWDIKAFDLPDDFDFESLVPLYVDDDGNAVEMPHEWNHGWDNLLVHTDHFSRYIIAQRAGP
jgi:hypothetical protein